MLRVFTSASTKRRAKDTGLCVALTDASAERSFISYIGAEGEVTAEDLNSVPAEAGDYVYLSGYSLLHEGKAQALLDWTLALPTDQRGVRSGPVGGIAGLAADAGVAAAHRCVDQQQCGSAAVYRR